MSQRRSQKRSARECGCHPWHHLYRTVRILFCQLQHQSRHSVNTGIPAAYHGSSLPFFCFLKGHAASLHLLRHRGGKILLSRQPSLQQIHIDRIADNYIAFPQNCLCLTGDLPLAARADSHYIDPILLLVLPSLFHPVPLLIQRYFILDNSAMEKAANHFHPPLSAFSIAYLLSRI